MVKLTYFGHSACFIEGKGLKGLVDPFFSDNPMTSAKPSDFTDVNYIFVTHGHFDHIGDTVEIALSTNATVVANAELCQYFGGKGLNTHPMHIGGTFIFPFGKVKMTPAIHGSDIVNENEAIPGGNPGGFLVVCEGKKIYHAGDTGLTMDMQLLRDEHIDVALLPSGGNFTMDMDDAAKAARMIMPRIAVPIHYNTFDVIKADPQEFARQAGKFTEVQILEPRESLEL